MAATRADLLKALVNDNYPYAVESFDAVEMFYPQVFEERPSTTEQEQWTSAMGPGLMVETAESEDINESQISEGFTVYCKARKFTDSVSISYEAVADNQKFKDFLKTWMQGYGETAAVTMDQSHADLFIHGGKTAGHAAFDESLPHRASYTDPLLCYDAKPFFNLTGNARTAKNGATYYNGVATLPFDESSIQSLWQLLSVTNAKTENGVQMLLRPNVLVCREGTDIWFRARQLFDSNAPTAAPNSGVSNNFRGILRVVGTPYISDTDFFALGVAKKGLVSIKRQPLTTDTWEDKKTQTYKLSATIRFGRTVRNFRPWVATNFATS